jgi:hypothetical protein
MQRIRAGIEAEAREIEPLLPVQTDGTRGPTRESYAAEAWQIRGVLFDNDNNRTRRCRSA